MAITLEGLDGRLDHVEERVESKLIQLMERLESAERRMWELGRQVEDLGYDVEAVRKTMRT